MVKGRFNGMELTRLLPLKQNLSPAGIRNHSILWVAILLLFLCGLNVKAQVRVSEKNRKRPADGSSLRLREFAYTI